MDRATVEERLHLVSRFISMHAGGVELSRVTDDGEVHVRFTGMCAGCPYRPVTMAATVRPALLEIDEVTAVHAVGSRISAEAERRLADDMVGHHTGIPRWPSGYPLLTGPEHDDREKPAV